MNALRKGRSRYKGSYSNQPMTRPTKTETAVEKMEEIPLSPLLFSNKSLGILSLLQIVKG